MLGVTDWIHNLELTSICSTFSRQLFELDQLTSLPSLNLLLLLQLCQQFLNVLLLLLLHAQFCISLRLGWITGLVFWHHCLPLLSNGLRLNQLQCKT